MTEWGEHPALQGGDSDHGRARGERGTRLSAARANSAVFGAERRDQTPKRG